MAKILKGNLHKTINVIVDRKIYKTVNFNDDGIFETNDEIIIKELKEYGYKVEETVNKDNEEPVKPRRRSKDIDE